MIHLPTPCHEKWDNMTPVDGGRHCGSCNKVLPDFSVMQEEQIAAYFKSATGPVCGQFRADQVSDGTTYGGWKFYSKWKTAVALLLIGSMFMISCRRHTRGCVAYSDKGDVKHGHKKEQKAGK